MQLVPLDRVTPDMEGAYGKMVVSTPTAVECSSPHSRAPTLEPLDGSLILQAYVIEGRMARPAGWAYVHKAMLVYAAAAVAAAPSQSRPFCEGGSWLQALGPPASTACAPVAASHQRTRALPWGNHPGAQACPHVAGCRALGYELRNQPA
jgi:hypothetical protein